MNRKIKYTFLIALFLVVAGNSFAAKRYWLNNAAANWNTTANWSATSGGASGASVPGSSDTAYFNSSGNGDCRLDVNVNVKRLEMVSGYDSTIIQNGYTITVGTGGGIFSGGTFSADSVAITFSGAFTLSGTSFTSTSGTLSCVGNFTFSSGSFSHNNGTVRFTTSNTITGSTTFYNLKFDATSAAKTYTIASSTTLTVNADLSYTGNNDININTGTIDVKGNIYLTSTAGQGGGSALLKISGTGSQTLSGTSSFHDNLPNVEINKSDTLHLSGKIRVTGNWTLTGGKIDAGSSSITFIGTKTITGTQTLNIVYFQPSSVNSTITIASTTTLTVSGELRISNNSAAPTAAITINTGTVYAKDDIRLLNTVSTGGGTTTIEVNGTGTQTIYGSTLNGYSPLPGLKVNKSTGILKMTGVVSIAGNYTYNSGTIQQDTSTVYFVGTNTITNSHTLKTVTFSTGTHTIASGTTLTVDSLLTVAGSTINTGTINATGNIALGSAGTAGGGSATLNITGTNNQSLTGNSSVGNDRLPNTVINKSSGTLSLSNTISVGGNWTYTAGSVSVGTSTVAVCTTSTVAPGSLAFNGFSLAPTATSTVTIASGDTVTVNGTLGFLGANSIIVNTGVLRVRGDISITNTSTVTTSGGTATILIDSTLNQTLTGSGVANTGYLPKIKINKTGGTLYLASQISSRQDWTYVTGTVDAITNASVIWFNGAFNLDAQGTSSTMIFNKVFCAGNSVRTLAGDLKMHDKITINAGSTLASAGYSITLRGDWFNNGTWTPGGSAVIIDSSHYQSINKASSALETFTNLTVNKSGGSLMLNTPVKITTALTLTKGKIKSSSTDSLEFAAGSSCSGGSDSGYVHGPVTKIGNTAFTFPLGDTTLSTGAYHPLGMSAPGSTADKYTGTYFPTGQTAGSTLVDSVESISSCEYWTLAKSTGTPSVTVTLGWNSNVCESNYTDFTVAAWNGSTWTDRGASSISSGGARGLVTSAGPISLSSPVYLTLGTKKPTGPYVLLHKQMDGGFYTIGAAKSLFFKFDDEYANANHTLDIKIWNESHTDVYPSLINHTHTSFYDDMRFKVDLFTSGFSPLSTGNYLMEVTNEKNEKQYLKFKIQ